MSKNIVKLATILIFTPLFLFVSAASIEARQGCCSHHGGVCGCDSSAGRQVCCDGTYSPSCTCAYNPPKPQPTVKPIIPTSTPKPTPTPMPIKTITSTPQPAVETTTSDSSSSGDNTIGWLTLAALGGGGYWLYKRAKNKKKPEETNTSEPTNQNG